MSDVNKVELRRLASAATGGDWEFRLGMIRTLPDSDGYVAVAIAPDAPKSWRPQRDANLEYIAAAKPAVVLALLDREAQAICEASHAAFQRDKAYAECAKLRAELEAIRGQEPVAWVSPDAVGGTRWKAGALQQLNDGSPLYALPPQQLGAEERDVPLHAAINRACGELPDGWSIEVNAERDGAWVALLNAELEVVEFPTNNERLDYTVNDAVEFALLSTRQAEEGE